MLFVTLNLDLYNYDKSKVIRCPPSPLYLSKSIKYTTKQAITRKLKKILFKLN